MAKPYFRQVPNFDYVSRDKNEQHISQYTQVKNLFKRGKLREDIFGNLTFFEKYAIIGDERPDNVAYKFYGDSTLDWIVLLSNNILNIQSEWPMTQYTFDKVMLEKYGTMEEALKYYSSLGVDLDESEIALTEELAYTILYSGIHHYETQEIRNSLGVIVLDAGLQVSSTWRTNGNFICAADENEENPISSYYYEYYDDGLGYSVQVPSTSFVREVTNYEYENKIENNKRNIYILKSKYLNIVFNDMDDIMPYKKGGSQFVTTTLKRGDNIRLYE